MRLAYLALFAGAAASGSFAQGLPTRKTLTFDLAQAIAQQVLATCRADGYKVSIRVVDADNVVKATLSALLSLRLREDIYVGRGLAVKKAAAPKAPETAEPVAPAA